MKKLTDNELYQKIHGKFKESSFEENIATTQGFLLGVICRGHGSSDKKSLELVTEILNGGTRLSGTGIALFTTMMIELERALKDKKLTLFVPASQEQSNKTRCSAIIDITYGFTLGILCEGNLTAGSIVEQEYAEKNELLNRDLELIKAISQLDPDSDVDEDDFNVVVDEATNSIYEIYTLLN